MAAVKIYLDNDVILNHSLRNAKPKSRAISHELFDSCKSGRKIGVISHLTLVELAGKCQRLAYEDTSPDMGDGASLAYALTNGAAIYDDFVKTVLRMSNIKLESPMNLKFSDVLREALLITRETEGRQFRGGSGFTRAGAADVLHVLLAKHVGCDEFHTFVKAVKRLDGHALVGSLNIVLH